jgi:hypothetical protein
MTAKATVGFGCCGGADAPVSPQYFTHPWESLLRVRGSARSPAQLLPWLGGEESIEERLIF